MTEQTPPIETLEPAQDPERKKNALKLSLWIGVPALALVLIGSLSWSIYSWQRLKGLYHVAYTILDGVSNQIESDEHGRFVDLSKHPLEYIDNRDPEYDVFLLGIRRRYEVRLHYYQNEIVEYIGVVIKEKTEGGDEGVVWECHREDKSQNFYTTCHYSGKDTRTVWQTILEEMPEIREDTTVLIEGGVYERAFATERCQKLLSSDNVPQEEKEALKVLLTRLDKDG